MEGVLMHDAQSPLILAADDFTRGIRGGDLVSASAIAEGLLDLCPDIVTHVQISHHPQVPLPTTDLRPLFLICLTAQKRLL